MDRLIKEDDEFILLKLATGETLVATMRAEDDQTISIESVSYTHLTLPTNREV